MSDIKQDPSKLKVAELRQALSSRGLDTKGNKPELVARLTASFASDPAQTPSNSTTNPPPNNTTTTSQQAQEAPKQSQVATSSSSSALSTTPSPSITSTASSNATTSSTIPNTETPLQVATEVKSNGHSNPLSGSGSLELTEAEKKKLRAQRFGVPYAPTEKDKKLARSARFGVPVSSDGSTDAAKLEARKKKFGDAFQQQQQPTGNKKLTTVERLGLPLKGGSAATEGDANTVATSSSLLDPERIKARQQRFNEGSAESEEKKKKRIERFATGDGEVSKRLRVDKPLEQQATSQ